MRPSHDDRGNGGGRSIYHLYLADARKVNHAGGEPRSLVESHLFYVIQVAKGYRNLGIPLEDLLSEGNLGLLEAAERFDRTRGVKFISYATWWIRKRICDLIARQVSLVRMPKYRLARLRRMRMVETDLRALLGREPTSEEVALRARLPRTEVDALNAQAHREISLDAMVNPDSELRLEEVLAERSTTPADDDLIEKNTQALLGSHLDRLPARQRQVILLHFGIGGRRPATLAEIGRRIGVSRERVRQLEKQGLLRLRSLMSPQQSRRTA